LSNPRHSLEAKVCSAFIFRSTCWHPLCTHVHEPSICRGANRAKTIGPGAASRGQRCQSASRGCTHKRREALRQPSGWARCCKVRRPRHHNRASGHGPSWPGRPCGRRWRPRALHVRRLPHGQRHAGRRPQGHACPRRHAPRHDATTRRHAWDASSWHACARCHASVWHAPPPSRAVTQRCTVV